MSSFLCRVVDAKGRRATITRDAPHKAAVLRDLNQEGYFIVSVEAASSAAAGGGRRLSAGHVLEFTQILATLLANGLQLKEALSIARGVAGASVRSLFRIIEEQVGKGNSLCDALGPWESSFSPLYLGLIRIGERTGDLNAVFQRLGEYLATKQAMRTKMINSLVYPLFVLLVAVVGIVLLMAVILPKLKDMIGALNPRAAEMYQRNVAIFEAGITASASILAFLAALFSIASYIRSRNQAWALRFALRFDSFALRIPIVGSFIRASFGLNFSFAMETLLLSGYALEDALLESSFVVGNRAYKAGLVSAREEVIKGHLLSASLQGERIFPGELTGWMAVGEGGNDLIKSFAQVRAFYQKETDKLYSRFMNLLEPALIVAVGGILMALILTFITPIFTMLGNLI